MIPHMQKLATTLSLLLLFRAADVFTVEPIDPPVGKMYWINDRADGVAPVDFFTIPHGKFVTRTGLAAKIPFPAHPHMLRHACGYKLANEGRDTRSLQHYLGQKNIAHTVRYAELTSDAFKASWKDKRIGKPHSRCSMISLVPCGNT